MRIAYLQPASGIAGNMLIGACLDAGLRWEDLAGILAPLAIGDWTPMHEAVVRGGLRATYFDVAVDDPKYTPHQHDHHHHPGETEVDHHHGPHRHYTDVVALVESATYLSPRVRHLALDALRRIGEVESALHGVSLEHLHLHEIGAMDTIIDVVGTCAAMELLGIERVYADPVETGSGQVKTAHGVVPVPTPAALAIFGDFPLTSRHHGHELATPTGAALLMALLDEHGTRHQRPPAFGATAVGYGAGKWELEDRPNVLRVTIGETTESANAGGWGTDEVVVLSTNLDDCSPELVPHVVSRLFATGALDVTVTPTMMKGGRPGFVLQSIAPPELQNQLLECLFRLGITLGVRIERVQRAVLVRREETGQLAGGTAVIYKCGLLDGEVVFRKIEYRTAEGAASESGQSVREVMGERRSPDDLPGWALQS
ncbi:MAG: nickel pincer cofactor biosynthesis protein LarC [bacterium]